MKKIYLLFYLVLAVTCLQAQNNVGIGTNTPVSSAKLDITATDKGLLIPRVALTATNVAGPITSPASSLLVYNTATASSGATFVSPGYYYWDGAKWVRLLNAKTVNANNGLSILGDSLIQLGGALIQPTTVSSLTATNKMSFTGTGVDAFNVDGTTLSIDATNDRVGVGTATPTEKLNVNGSVLLPTGSSYWIGNNADANDRMRVHLSGTTGYIDYATGDLNFRSGTTTRVVMQADGDVGIGITVPDDKLDVSGNAQVSGYIKAGNPTAPNIPAGYDIIYQDDFEGDVFWTIDGTQNCGSGNWEYPLLTSGDLFTTAIGWNTAGSYSRKRFQSPSIWIPSYYTSFYITDNSRSIGGSDESGFDGVYLLWKDEGTTGTGTTWTKITTFNSGGYSGHAATGASTSCGAGSSQSCWDFNDKGSDYGLIYDETTNISSTGRYIRVGFEGMEDASADDETFYIYDCVVYGNRPAFSSTFNAGSIYAEGPIFASVQYRLGDLAEYFEVDKNTEAGDLIAISDKGNDKYTKATAQQAHLLLGVHSANPTITLNSPKNGIPVALAGRVPVKVNAENGPIKIGDYLTISSQPGIATKATHSGYVIGRALENFDAKEGKILCMVEPGMSNIDSRPTSTSGGSFKFDAGKNIVKVLDQSIQASSRVFVSFREFAGSEYKIGKVGNGYFTIELKQNTKSDIPFDYFVDNAKQLVPLQGNSGEVTLIKNSEYIPQLVGANSTPNSLVKNGIKKEATVDSENKLSQELEKQFPSKQIAFVTPKVDEGLKTPPLPPDPNQVWLWTADRGFFTMADVKKSKSPYKEIQNQKK